MSRKHTYAEIASSFELWQKFVDPQGVMSRKEFDAMSHADRIAIQIGVFGPEDVVPTVSDLSTVSFLGEFREQGVYLGPRIPIGAVGVIEAIRISSTVELRPGWHTATISFKLGDDGSLQQFKDYKISSFGEDMP